MSPQVKVVGVTVSANIEAIGVGDGVIEDVPERVVVATEQSKRYGLVYEGRAPVEPVTKAMAAVDEELRTTAEEGLYMSHA